MTEENKDAAGSQDQSPYKLVVKYIYLKDLSFESPRPIEQLEQTGEQPEINVHLQIETRALGEADSYEVLLGVTVTANRAGTEETLYLIEVKQGGVFVVQGFTGKELEATLNIYCPNILFPYVREAVSGMVERGGFPQLLLRPINFEAFYEQQMKKRSVNIAEADSSAEH
jgi:preprotein translocase subunit SecB